MDLLTRLSRQTIRIGSSDACEVHLDDPKIAPVAAEVIHQGGGSLVFLPTETGDCSVDGRSLPAGTGVPFDFRTPFSVGGVPVPLSHPDLCLMVMSLGHSKLQGCEFIVGRDPERCHLVLSSKGVSGRHASLYFEEQTFIEDHRSTSGTWLLSRRLEPETRTLVQADDVLALGPLPLPVALARQLFELLSDIPSPRTSNRTESMPRRTAAAGVPSSLPAMPSAKHRTVMGTIKMAQAKTFTIGRTTDNDIVLDYAQVASLHAKLTIADGDLFLEDAGSESGTSVRGTRLKKGQKAKVSDGQRVLFGPMPAILRVHGDKVDLVVEDHEGWAGRPLFEVAAAGITIVVPDRHDTRRTKTLLDDVSFKALPGDFVALMGPSGSGKTTLLHVLTGYLRPSAGEVLVNDAPLPAVFETLRGSIGYVPQDDIVHPELTVFEAVRYSARFRLPTDYEDDEIDRRVRATLTQLGLESVAHLRIGTPEAKVLSGGQRKRVNIAMELVTDPVLVFLDEPTSGLAADDTTALVDLLSRLATDHGKTIIATIHQPARDEYEKFNLALVLGHGGIPLYFGPSVAAYSFFESWRGPLETRGISTPRDMFAELAERQVRLQAEMPDATLQQVRETVSLRYRNEYERSEVVAAMAAAERSVAQHQSDSLALPKRERPRRQMRLLLSRYVKIKTRDRTGTAILLLQAPLIGVLLSLVFGAQYDSVPYWCLGALNQLAEGGGHLADTGRSFLTDLQKAPDHAPALFFLVVAAVWFGTSNAARELVSERAIFRRERMINLSVLNYVLSKFLVLCGLCIAQCTILLSIVFLALGLAGGFSAYAATLQVLILTACCSVALGLLLSAVVRTSEAAMALTPIALIPQVVLGGIMVPVTTNRWLEIPMMLMPSRWGFEGVVRPEREAVAHLPAWKVPLRDVSDSPPDFIEGGAFDCARAQMESHVLRGAWGFSGDPWWVPAALSGMTLFFLLVVFVALKRAERGSA